MAKYLEMSASLELDITQILGQALKNSQPKEQEKEQPVGGEK